MYGNYPDLLAIHRVLVVKLRHHGDVLLTSPVFSALQRAMPWAKLDAYLYRDTYPMLEGHSALHGVHLYDRKWKERSFLGKTREELHLLWQIRQSRYDMVINLTEGDRGAIAAKMSGAPIKVGVDPGKGGMKGKKNIYTHLVRSCSTPRHAVERNLDALRRVGIFPQLQERDLQLVIPPQAAESMLQRTGEKNYIVIHPVSRWQFKCTPPSWTAGLIRELHQRGENIVLSSGPDESELRFCQEILQLAPEVPLLNLAGKITLKELAALIGRASVLICVDSVPLHIASALKTPVVALFGPSSEVNWGPWMHPLSRVIAQNVSCRPCHLDGCGGSKMSDCLYTLPISKVVEAIYNLKSSPK